MLYRETGDFKTSYARDQQIFPVLQDRVAFWALLAVAFLGSLIFVQWREVVRKQEEAGLRPHPIAMGISEQCHLDSCN